MDAANIVTVFIGIESPQRRVRCARRRSIKNVKKTDSIVDPRPQSCKTPASRSGAAMIRRLRPRTTPDLQGPARVPPPDRHHAFHGRHALRRSRRRRLHASLEERRPALDLDDEQPFGTNVISARHDRAKSCATGTSNLMQELYDPRLLLRAARKSLPHKKIRFGGRTRKLPTGAKHPWRKWKSQSVDAALAAGAVFLAA